MLKYAIFLSLIISSLAYIPCTAACIKCEYSFSDENNEPYYECRQCADGYVLDDKKYNNEGCIKKCVESTEETQCKICNEKQAYKCQKCWEEHGYRLDSSERKCYPYFAFCKGTKFFDCIDCESKTNNDSTVSSRCTRCYDHYTLVDGICEYDINYQKSKYNKANILLLIIILLL